MLAPRNEAHSPLMPSEVCPDDALIVNRDPIARVPSDLATAAAGRCGGARVQDEDRWVLTRIVGVAGGQEALVEVAGERHLDTALREHFDGFVGAGQDAHRVESGGRRKLVVQHDQACLPRLRARQACLNRAQAAV